MSTQATQLVLDYMRETPDLGPAERLALLSLAARVNHARGDWRVWPTLDVVAREMGVSQATARRALQRLTERGLLSLDREGRGRGNPSVYVFENLSFLQGFQDAKTSQIDGVKPRKREPPIKSNKKQQEGTNTASSKAEALAQLWNAVVTRPIPAVRLPLSEDRVRRYARAADSMTADEWRAVVEYLNRQSWCRAPGTGDHPNWTATLDWLTSAPAVWQRHLERAQAEQVGPASKRQARDRTRDVNAQRVAGDGLFIVSAGGDR